MGRNHFIRIITCQYVVFSYLLSSISSTMRVPLWTISHNAAISLTSSRVYPNASARITQSTGLHLLPPLSSKSQTGSEIALVKDTRSLLDPVYYRFSDNLLRSPSFANSLGITYSKTPHSLNSLPYSTKIFKKSSEEIAVSSLALRYCFFS